MIQTNISPKIEGLLIHPVPLEKEDEVAYVVEIPQSTKAHQNTKDHRYYRRHNFESVPMLDYEIRDIVDYGKYYSFDDWSPKYGPSRFDPILPEQRAVAFVLSSRN